MKMDNILEVSPGIFRIRESGVLGMLKPPVNIYVITGRNGIVYDSGYGNRGMIKSFVKQYREICRICTERGIENNIDRILLSHAHADHFSGLKELRKRLGLRIIVTGEMKDIISSRKVYTESYSPPDKKRKKTLPGRIKRKLKNFTHIIEYGIYDLYWGVSFVNDPDLLISSESGIIINDEKWNIFSSPGHSHEHITLYNQAKGILFSGDNVLKSINVWLGPPKSDIDQYENSLKYMISLPSLKIILPAHGSPVTDPYGRLKEIIEWRKKRTDDILNILKSVFPGGLSVSDLLDILYPGERRMKKEFASGWVELTLQKLKNENKVNAVKNKFFYQ